MNFFDNHGMLVLLFLATFPRLTLLFGGFASGGLLWWLSWLIAPHFLIAFLALPYWETNPILVVLAWIIALGGTSSEGFLARLFRRRKN